MFDIYGRGYWATQILSRANDITKTVFENLINTDGGNFAYSRLNFRENSSIMHNTNTTRIPYNQIRDTNIRLNNYFPQTPSHEFLPYLGQRYNPIEGVKKILLSYQTFGEYKQTRKYGYYDSVYLIGNGASAGDYMLMARTDANSNPLVNYQDDTKYDNYIAIVGYAFYNDDKELVTDQLVHYIDLIAQPTGIISTGHGRLPRTLSSQNIDYDNRICNILPLGGLTDQGTPYAYFNILGDVITPRKSKDEDGESYFYNLANYKYKNIAPYVNLCVGFQRTGMMLNNKYGTGLPVFTGRALALFPDLLTLINYLEDFGFEVYTSLEDLMTDDGTNDEDLPDFGYTPPTIPSGVPDNSSDDVTPSPTIITPSSVSKTYALTWQQFQDFQNWICATDFLTALSKYFTDPLDGIVSLKLYPFDFYDHDSAYLLDTSNITIVNQSKDITCKKFLRQYNYVFDGGSYTYQPYYGDFNDYIASYSLYIPFVGTCNLEPAEVIGKTISLTYGIDILSGQCQVLVYSNSVLIRALSGVCGMDIPLTGTSYTQAVRNAVNYAVGLGTQIAGAVITGIPAFGAMGKAATMSEASQTMRAASLTAQGVNAAVDTTQTVLQMLPQNQQQFQTKASPCTALFAPQVPYLTIVLPQPVYPKNRQQFEGYNASMTAQIGTLDGYCKGTPYGDWDILGASVEEINMIKQIVQGGFYI